MLAHMIGDLEDMLSAGSKLEDPEKKVDIHIFYFLLSPPIILVLFALC